ncbi:MAG: hypothetical protein GXP19_03385 [Gammaproteobacteria bacterium]|nr:hypothetical protein [Gammaproteobacteria bacterium]
MIYTQTGSATRTTLIVIVGVCVFLAVAVMLLPKGFSDDLSIIGKNMAAVVLTHDKNSVESLEYMTLLNTVRSNYTGKVNFLVVDVNTREGQAFRQQQRVGAVVLVFFSPDGTRRGTRGSDIGEMELRSELDKLLSP